LAYDFFMRTLLAALILAAAPAVAGTTQEHVHNASHGVMPFDMSKSLHVFAMDAQGGVQKVVARDGAGDEQIKLIRQHLQHEAQAFAKGDFGDPGHLHGDTMPGLAEVKANAAKIRVEYSPLPSGAQITFRAGDIQTITAIHRWFGAQLSEHGADAKAE
jgi:hypothetical protein